MQAILNYFFPRPGRIIFEKWTESYLNRYYNGLAIRLQQFAKEAGDDEYGRHFIADPIVQFAIDAKVTDKSIEHIYRHYVYYKIEQVNHIDVEKEELADILGEFFKIPDKRDELDEMIAEFVLI